MVVQQARQNLIDFSIATDPKYQDTWFHEKLASVLQGVVKKIENGQDVRLIIECPPRHGKSELATKKFPAWVLGQHPEWPVIVSSYSADLAVEFGQGTRDIMQSGYYENIFKTRLRPDTTAKGRWMTDSGGGYTAVGVGGSITGKGFVIGIIDDPFKNREEADSEVIRESRWSWYRSTFYTRREGVSAIIVIMTRWHNDDLVGRLLDQQAKKTKEKEENIDRWVRIRFPAIAEENEDFRKIGDPLWPAKFDLASLETTRNTLGPYEWSALYQARPISSENQEFKEQWLKYRNWSEVEYLETRKFATMDTGGAKKENDYTGIVRNYVDSQNMWNIKAMRVHFDPKEIINYIFVLHDEGFEAIGVEETMYTIALKPFLDDECIRRNKFPNIIPLKHHSTQKEVRIRGLIPRYAAGSIFHIAGTCNDLETEMVSFPKGANDDTLDAFAMQLEIAEAPMAGYLKQEITYERQKRKVDVRKSFGL